MNWKETNALKAMASKGFSNEIERTKGALNTELAAFGYEAFIDHLLPGWKESSIYKKGVWIPRTSSAYYGELVIQEEVDGIPKRTTYWFPLDLGGVFEWKDIPPKFHGLIKYIHQLDLKEYRVKVLLSAWLDSLPMQTPAKIAGVLPHLLDQQPLRAHRRCKGKPLPQAPEELKTLLLESKILER